MVYTLKAARNKQIQHINEALLNEEMNKYRETVFDEAPYFIKLLMECIHLHEDDAFKFQTSLQELYEKVTARTESLKLKDTS